MTEPHGLTKYEYSRIGAWESSWPGSIDYPLDCPCPLRGEKATRLGAEHRAEHERIQEGSRGHRPGSERLRNSTVSAPVVSGRSSAERIAGHSGTTGSSRKLKNHLDRLRIVRVPLTF